MTKFKFETRELCPYRKGWSNNGNFNGALWYIKEKDGIYLWDSMLTRPSSENTSLQETEIPIARGLPAALLAQGDALVNPDFDFEAFIRAYNLEMNKLFPERPAFVVPFVLKDWELFLAQAVLVNNDSSGYFDNFSRMRVAVFLREMSNPYKMPGLENQIKNNHYFIYRHNSLTEPQFVFSQMPSVAERIAAPVILKSGMNQSDKNAILQTDGFAAAVINLAMDYYWKKRWSQYNFNDFELIKQINQAIKKNHIIIDIADLNQLSFELPIEVEDICMGYMDVFLPTMQKVWKLKPDVQLECVERENIYTYIYACEASSRKRLLESELYAHLNQDQQRLLYNYCKRFSEWLIKNYHITAASQHRVMQAIGRDMPPIELTIQTNVQVTRAGKQVEQSESKFKYIISDNDDVIQNIHKRIELHLSSPAGLRDELAKLHNEKLISLPMDKPTDIIREVRNVWSNAPKERSFVTTWGRRF